MGRFSGESGMQWKVSGGVYSIETERGTRVGSSWVEWSDTDRVRWNSEKACRIGVK